MRQATAQRLGLMAQVTFWFTIFLIICAVLWLFKSVLAPFIMGFIIAYLLNPLIRRLQTDKFSRKAATLVILSTFFIVLALIIAIVSPIATRELGDLVDAFPGYMDGIWTQIKPTVNKAQAMLGLNYTGNIADTVGPFLGEATNTSKNVAKGIFTGGAAVVDFTITFFITPIVAYFLIKDWPKIIKWVENLMPRDHEHDLHQIFKQIDKKLAGFIRGQLTVCLVLGVGYAIALTIAGLKYGFLIGLLSGLLSIIPFVGSAVGLTAAVIVAWFQAGEMSYVAIIAAIFLFGQFLEGNFLSPKLVGDSVGMHPLWVLFSVMAGGAVFGIVGMILAVPVAAISGVLISFFIGIYKKSALYKEEQTKAKKRKKKS